YRGMCARQWKSIFGRAGYAVFIFLVIFCMMAVGLAAQSDAPNARASNKPYSESSEQFFESQNVSRLTIETTDEELQKLKINNRKYVRATVHEGELVYHDVGIHLKGSAGSFRELEDRPSLTLNFDKFNHGQNFHGLDKIHLNNSVQDPSYLTDILCGELFLAA